MSADGDVGGSRRRRLPRLILLFVVGALVVAWFVLVRRPGWYEQAAEVSPAARQVATAVENAVTTDVTRIRDESPWGFLLTQDQVNAWLANRLPEWDAGRTDFAMPEEILDPRVRFIRDRVEVAALVPTGAIPIFVSLTVAPRVEDDALVLEFVDSSVVGPGLGGDVIDLVDGWIESGEGFGWDSEVGGWRMPAAWTLGDGRRVVLEDLEVLPGELGIQFRTESP